MKYKILFWVAIAYQIFSIVIIILWAKHDCPECIKSQQEVNEKYVEQIKEISNAETKDDVDSLLHEFYGFKSK